MHSQQHSRRGTRRIAATVAATGVVVVAATAGVVGSAHAGTGATSATSQARQAGAATALAAPSASALAARAAAPGQTVTRVTGAKAKTVYLTFDDGPNRAYTPQVLALLKRYNAKATFFMIGSAAKADPALVRRVRAEGHAIGNHTFNHPWLTRLSRAGIAGQLTSTDASIGRTTCMRPPGGFVNQTVKRVAASQGKSVVLWSVDTNDWRRPGSSSILRSVTTGARAGNIILMHDGGGPRTQTVAALSSALARLSAQGYRFAPLPMCR